LVKLDKDRLAKLLSMTGSEHDAEALAAIRKANELLRLNKKSWSEVLGDPPPAVASRAEAPRYAARPASAPAGPPEPPSGHQRLRDYRNALRREPFLPRLLGFPFWLLIEMLAFVFPRAQLNTRGGFIATVFALGMLTGIASWIWLGYYLIIVA
jgi:hypothetical protein